MVETETKIQRYESYKDSGVEWLGEIPEHWSVLPTKRFHSVKKELNYNRSCENVLSLTLRGVVNNNIDNPEGLVPKDYATYQIFEKDNLVFKLIDLENVRTSRVGIVHEKGIMSSAYIRLVVGSENSKRYAYYFYFDLYLNRVYNNLGSGVRSTLGPNDLLNIPFIKPPLTEQTAIAQFLDDKITKIDQAIDIKQQQIALLKERKQILIHKAVTRGLNNNVALKDSGVEWIGEIPEHWQILFNRRLFRENTKRKFRGDELPLSLSQVDGVIPSQSMKERSLSPSHRNNFKLCMPNDLIVNRFKGHLGVLFKSDYKGLVTFHYGVFEPENNVDTKYFEHLFHTNIYKNIYAGASNGMTIGLQNLSNQNFYDVKSIVPPIEEQKQIVEYIENISAKIESGISLKAQEISKLQEYKSSLINSVVTGKVRVC